MKALPSCRPASAIMTQRVPIRIGLRRDFSRSPMRSAFTGLPMSVLRFSDFRFGGARLGGAAGGGDEVGLGGVGIAGRDRLAALVAHALHDGVEVGCA